MGKLAFLEIGIVTGYKIAINETENVLGLTSKNILDLKAELNLE